MRAKLGEAGLAPGEGIGFLLSGVQEQVLRSRGARREGLTVVERLGCDLTCVVNAHERRGALALGSGQFGYVRAPRDGAPGLRGEEYGPQGAVERDNYGVEQRNGLHRLIIQGRICQQQCIALQ